MAHERYDTHVSQLSDCYQNRAFSQSPCFFKILFLDLIKNYLSHSVFKSVPLSVQALIFVTVGEKKSSNSLGRFVKTENFVVRRSLIDSGQTFFNAIVVKLLQIKCKKSMSLKAFEKCDLDVR